VPGVALPAAPAAAAAPPPLRVLAYSTQGFFARQPDGQDGGLEYQMLLYYERKSGRPLVVQYVDNFDDLLPMLLQGKGDVIAATMTVTPERSALVDFSEPYFTVQIRLVERQDHPLHALADVMGKHVGVIGGTTADHALTAVPGVKVERGDLLQALFDRLAAGQLDALATDSSLALSYIRRYPQLAIGPPLSGEQHYAFAVPKGSPLRDALSHHVQDLKTSGIYYRFLREEFGDAAVAMAKAGHTEN
jgi:polar amino acid transport system substrate-binding protein